MEKVLKIKEQFNQIIIYRHVNPDLDAFGSQLGLYWTLKAIYPQKNIVLAGEMSSDLLKYYASFEVGEVQDGKTMGIVLDTANRERIDGDIKICDYILKIDHHIIVDSYGDENIEDEEASSCSEIVTLLLKQAHIQIPLEAANALYLGIIGDSNRFLYQSTSQKTFEAASYLLDMKIDIEKLYQQLYMRTKKDLEITKFIYNHYQQDGPVAWYYLSDEDLKTLQMSREQGSSYVNTLANFEEFQVWLAITENKKENNYRVSMRSRQIPVNEIAALFHGGGHAYASGATLQSLDELNQLIKRLKEKIDGEYI